MVYGLVDMGANSIRLSIYQVEGGKVKLLINKKETAGLSTYKKNGVMTQAGINKACHVLASFQTILNNFNITDVCVFATASLRNIDNTDEAVSYIEQKTGIAVDVLSGAEEARLDFIGISHVADIRDGLLIDIGGGSTELAEFRNGRTLSTFSMPIGSLNLYVKHVKNVLPSDLICRNIRLDILEELGKVTFSGSGKYPYIYGIGGTIRSTARLANNMFELSPDNQVIRYADLCGILQKYKQSKQFVLKSILQTSPERIHTLIPGMIILKSVAKRFGGNIILANNFGLREGYLYDKVPGGQALC